MLNYINICEHVDEEGEEILRWTFKISAEGRF